MYLKLFVKKTNKYEEKITNFTIHIIEYLCHPCVPYIFHWFLSGAAAILLSQNKTLKSREVNELLIRASTPNRLPSDLFLPNRLLYIGREYAFKYVRESAI